MDAAPASWARLLVSAVTTAPSTAWFSEYAVLRRTTTLLRQTSPSVLHGSSLGAVVPQLEGHPLSQHCATPFWHAVLAWVAWSYVWHLL